jgi:hypothetical protein
MPEHRTRRPWWRVRLSVRALMSLVLIFGALFWWVFARTKAPPSPTWASGLSRQ